MPTLTVFIILLHEQFVYSGKEVIDGIEMQQNQNKQINNEWKEVD